MLCVCLFCFDLFFYFSEAEPELGRVESPSVSSLQWSSETEEEQRPVDEKDITVSVLHTDSDSSDKTGKWTLRKDEHEREAQEVKKGAEDSEVKGKERETVCKQAVMAHEAGAEVKAEDECEKEQMEKTEREPEDSTALSEKERQNEELNEKDNCSASSMSSASSTLEREEREEKLKCDNESGKKTLLRP